MIKGLIMASVLISFHICPETGRRFFAQVHTNTPKNPEISRLRCMPRRRGILAWKVFYLMSSLQGPGSPVCALKKAERRGYIITYTSLGFLMMFIV